MVVKLLADDGVWRLLFDSILGVFAQESRRHCDDIVASGRLLYACDCADPVLRRTNKLQLRGPVMTQHTHTHREREREKDG